MILITGKNGTLGWELRRALAPLGPVAAVDAAELPLQDSDAIRRVIRKVRPTIVVNAAAHTGPDRDAEHGELAMAVNGVAPAIIADEVNRLGGGLVHFSSGCVFDGVKKRAYDEGDPPRPASLCGETRLAGETGLRGVGVPHLIFRTSWVYGARGNSFVRSTLAAAADGRPLRAVDDRRGAPTWCRMVAEATALVLAQTGASQRPDALEDFGGTYHLAAAGEATWYEFAQAILERAPEPLRAGASRVVPVSSGERPARTRRPEGALLDCTKFTETFGFALPDWRASLDLVMEEVGQAWGQGIGAAGSAAPGADAFSTGAPAPASTTGRQPVDSRDPGEPTGTRHPGAHRGQDEPNKSRRTGAPRGPG